MLETQEALKAVLDISPTREVVYTSIHCSVNKTLALPIMADRDYPPHDRVCMDGIALEVSEEKLSAAHTYKIQGIQAAGAPPLELLNTSEAIEVMTGASLPSHTNTVIPYESLNARDDGFSIKSDTEYKLGANIQLKGSDYKSGQLLLSPPLLLKPSHLVIAANCGIEKLPTYSPPRIAVLATGSELVGPHQTPLNYQIRHTNDLMVKEILKEWNFEISIVNVVEDAVETLSAAIQNQLNNSDVLIISGGVSKGKFDFIPGLLENLGVEKIFHLVKQKPGKPLWYGKKVLPEGVTKYVFGLPGNPLAVQVNTIKYIIPFLKQFVHQNPTISFDVVLGENLSVNAKLTQYIPASILLKEGKIIALPQTTKGSGDFFSLKNTHGMLECSLGPKVFPPGTLLPFYPWKPFL